MQQSLKAFSKFVFFGLLICIMTAFVNENTYLKADAATLKPSLKEKKITLYVGYDTYKMKINNLAKKAKVTYETDDTEIATVNKSGKITPKSKGTTEVSATVIQNKKTYQLVMEIEVQNPSVKITDSTSYLNVSDTYTFKCETIGIKENVNWYVSDGSKANITADGKLTATAAGKITVTANAGDVTAECSLSIGSNRIGTFSNNITCYNEPQTIWISVADKSSNEDLSAANSNPDLFDYQWGEKVDNKEALTITPKKSGQGKLTIYSDKTEDQLIINVNINDRPYNSSVTNVKDASERYSSATVQITTFKNSKESRGTGFFIANGMIVTNNHIINGADKIIVRTINNASFEVQSIVGYDEISDIAILKTDVNSSDYLTISQSTLKAGNDVYSFGDPLQAGITALSGSISKESYIYNNINYIQITTPISEQSSGGPVINSMGEVIGINTVFCGDQLNPNLVISSKEILKINTNRFISLADYKQRLNNKMMSSVNYLINEDNLYSFNNSNYAYSYGYAGLPSGIGLNGVITKYSSGDNYRLKINYRCVIVAECYFTNYNDYKKTNFDLCDSSMKRISASTSSMGTLSYKITYTLSPGEYLLNIHTRGYYEEEDIPYFLKVLY